MGSQGLHMARRYFPANWAQKSAPLGTDFWPPVTPCGALSPYALC